MVNLNSWGSIKFVSGKFTGVNYVPVGFYLTNSDGDILYEFNSPFTYSVNIVFNGREQEFVLVESDDIVISNMLFTGEYHSEDGKKYTFFNNAKANFDGYTFNYTINKDAGEPGCDYILDMTNKNDYKRIAYEFKNDLLYLYYSKYTNIMSRNDEPFAILHRTNELTEDFNELSTFWNNLRNSVLNKDLDAIEKLTQFPLETRGPMDYHPIIKFDRDKFKEVFLLFINDNYNKIKDSEELYFKNKEDYDKPLDRTKFKDYTKIILVNNDFAAICSMGFKFKDSSWKLTSLYLSEESYKRLGIDIYKKIKA